jgi:CheY-like chemotaxis protein
MRAAGGAAGMSAARKRGEDAGEPPPLLLSQGSHAMRLTILYAEDDKLVADAVRDLLEGEGWSVEVCADGFAAQNRLAGGVRYDLLLLDNDLPGASGMELIRYARNLRPYRTTPIIMLSASDRREDALRAGANLFLRKPEGIGMLLEAVRRLTE